MMKTTSAIILVMEKTYKQLSGGKDSGWNDGYYNTQEQCEQGVCKIGHVQLISTPVVCVDFHSYIIS